MARAPRLYTKLAPRRGGIGSYCSLWLASDHVLSVESNMVTERYQRIWLRDVQAFFVRPSRESRLTIMISLPALILFALMWALGGETTQIFGAVFSILSGIVLLYGLIFARTCHFHVVTAVQRTEWTNVARRRRARKILAKLEPLVRAAQAAGGDPARSDDTGVSVAS